MPRVPTHFYAGKFATPALGAGIVPQGAQELANVLNRGVQQIGGAIVAQAQDRLVLEAKTAGLRAINDAQQAAEDPSLPPEDMLKVFDEGAQKGLTDAQDALGDFQSYAPRLQGEMNLQMEARRASILHQQVKRTEDAQLRALGEHLDETRRSIGATGSQIEAMELWHSAHKQIEESPLSEVAKGRAASSFDRGIDLDKAFSMLKTDPAALLREASSPEIWNQRFPHLTPHDAYSLGASANTELSRRDTAAREAKADANERSVKGWLDRVYGPIDQLPSVSDVLADPHLLPSAAEHFVQVIEKRAAGQPEKILNERLASDLYRRVHEDPTSPDVITDFTKDILPYVGNGLTRTVAEQLRADLLEQKKDPMAKTRDKPLEDYLKNAKSQLNASTFLSNNPAGDQKFWEFQYKARQQWAAKLAAGQDPSVLVDPTSKEFLGKQLKPPSLQEQRQALFPSPLPPTPPPPTQELPENPDDYLKSIGK